MCPQPPVPSCLDPQGHKAEAHTEKEHALGLGTLRCPESPALESRLGPGGSEAEGSLPHLALSLPCKPCLSRRGKCRSVSEPKSLSAPPQTAGRPSTARAAACPASASPAAPTATLGTASASACTGTWDRPAGKVTDGRSATGSTAGCTRRRSRCKGSRCGGMLGCPCWTDARVLVGWFR